MKDAAGAQLLSSPPSSFSPSSSSFPSRSSPPSCPSLHARPPLLPTHPHPFPHVLTSASSCVMLLALRTNKPALQGVYFLREASLSHHHRDNSPGRSSIPFYDISSVSRTCGRSLESPHFCAILGTNRLDKQLSSRAWWFLLQHAIQEYFLSTATFSQHTELGEVLSNSV